MMDQGDAYTSSRLLYKCDRNIAVIYAQAMRAAMGEDVATDQLLREIDNVIFQNFKYKTALVSLQKDHEANKASQSKADLQIEKSKSEIEELNERVKAAQLVRKRKLEFNELVHSIKKFEIHNELQSKISQVELEISQMEAEYERETASFAEKERCLRIALSALTILLGSDS